MKKLILIAVMFVSLNTIAQGQSNGTSEELATVETNKIEKTLSLTPEQKTKVYNVALIKYNTIKRRNEEHKNDTDKKTLNEGIKSTNEAFDNEVNSVLTPEQKLKWKEYKKNE